MSIEEHRAEGEVLEDLPAEDGEGAAGDELTETPAPAVKARPVEEGERVASVDVIRGVALLGILAMNIVSFAWPDSVYEVPIMDPDAGPLDSALWALNHLVFETK